MSSRRADMFIEPGNDPRDDPPTQGDERATLSGFLRWQRATLELKCSGLDPADLARRSVEPSTMSLLGLVRHMADVERGWFRRIMAGQDAPPHFRSPAEPDGDFEGAVPDPDVVAEAWVVWRAEVAFADRLVAEAPDLGTTGKIPDASGAASPGPVTCPRSGPDNAGSCGAGFCGAGFCGAAPAGAGWAGAGSICPVPIF